MQTDETNFITQKIKENYHFYTEFKKAEIFLITWNVNSFQPGLYLNELFEHIPKPLPRILVISLQEINMNLDQMIWSQNKIELDWIYYLGCVIPNSYKLIKYGRLVGLFLGVFLLKDFEAAISNLSICVVPTGAFNMIGNKGGIGIRFNYHDTSICIIGSHFAAHQDEVEKRNQNFNTIYNNMNFCLLPNQEPIKIKHHDIVFWCGDLNYRISRYTQDTITRMIKLNELEKLLEYDQLKFQMSIGKCFGSFKEGEINFLPSYKYIVGTRKFDIESKRLPAFCDRILWLETRVSDTQAKQAFYKSLDDICQSDHKPVISLFEFRVSFINKEKYKEALIKINKHIDKYNNRLMPSIVLSTNELKFGKIHFLISTQQCLIINNDGISDCYFKFIDFAMEQNIIPSWLTLSQYEGTINKGESLTIYFIILIEKLDLANLKSNQLNCNVVLHLEGGRDHFISLSAEYVPSCYGTDLKTLLSIKKPMKTIQNDLLIDFKDDSINLNYNIDFPFVFYNLTEYLLEHFSEKENIFENIGLRSQVIEIINVLDYTDKKIEQVLTNINVDSVAEAYSLYLETLPTPVIPTHIFTTTIRRFEECQDILIFLKQKLPSENIILLKLITLLLKTITKDKNQSQHRTSFLYSYFLNLIGRSDNLNYDTLKLYKKHQYRIMYILLQNF